MDPRASVSTVVSASGLRFYYAGSWALCASLTQGGHEKGHTQLPATCSHRVHGSLPLCVESTRAAATRPGWRAGPIGGMRQVQEVMATSREQTTPPRPPRPPVLEGIPEGAHPWLGWGVGVRCERPFSGQQGLFSGWQPQWLL